MSIIRVGLSETKHFAEGYDAIFGKKQAKSATAGAKPKKQKVKKAKKRGKNAST